MFPVLDQNRQDAHPQTVHVHMHQVCACMHQYFPNYRPHILAPYHIHPVPRPFNMQHYQYTQFNLSPFNMPLVHPGTSMTQAATLTPATQQTTSSNLDFGPPPRDRRHFETAETPTQDTPSTDVSKENFLDDYNLTMSNLSDALQEAHGASTSIENFTKFLEQGCIVAEKIAIRNQHRPCFKNIQNLCNRTRSEILKPSNTVSNIHSQGIPWATKDFIYAFVRLINCWHMLKGYLDSKDGTLGNIDRELTPEFKNCYLSWEKNTKELAAHMIRIFTNLDNNVSNPNAVTHNKIKQAVPQETCPVKVECSNSKLKETIKSNRNVSNTSNTEFNENILLTESPTTPRDDDSDNEGRIYMKPGSYNVPKKNNESPNSSPSIEFFDTAQNVSAHYKKIAKKKGENGLTSTNDKMWQDAQSAVPYLMNKINAPQQAEVNDRSTDEVDALKYFVDLNTLDHQASNIQEWLNNNNFFEQQNCSENIHETSTITPSSSITFNEKPVTVLQRSHIAKMGSLVDQDINFYGQAKGFYKSNGNRIEVQSRTYRKKVDCPEKAIGKSIINKKSCPSTWEYEQGGLTTTAWMVMEDIVKILEQEEFAKRIDRNDAEDRVFEDEPNQVTSLVTVRKKVTNRKYDYINEFVADLKSVITCAEIFYETHQEIIHYITLFDRKLDLLLNRDFFAFDFSFLSSKSDDLGPLVLKANRKSEGDGDH